MPISALTPLQARFAKTYDFLVRRANVKPNLYSIITGHNFYKINTPSARDLDGFFLAPDFAGTVIYCPDEIYIDLFKDIGLELNSENLGMIISWNAFGRLIRDCQKEQDEAGEHTFKYLQDLLSKRMHHHKDEKLLFLVKQTIDFNTPTKFKPRIVSSK